MKSQKVEFTPPEDVTDQLGNVPRGTRLELMCRVAVKDNGRWCLVAIEGIPMPGYDGEGNENNEKPETLDMGAGERMASRMKGMMSEGADTGA